MASNFQRKIIKEYKAKGYTVVSVVKLSANGYPDVLCMKDGKCIWIECKEADDTLKPLQKLRIRELRANGFEAFCLKSDEGKIF